MASKKLFALAFAYKKEKLWKRLFDTEIFAVRLPDGEIGYCCVMGYGGEHIALAVYPGAKGWTSFRTIADRGAEMAEYDPYEDDEGDFDRDDFRTLMLSQDCLQCAFENRDDLSDEEVEEARRAARENGAALRGANSFPHFVKYIPNRFPWHYETKQDDERMCAALSAALSLSMLLKSHSKSDLGLAMVDADTKEVPFFEWEEDGWTLSRTPLPELLPPSYPTPGELSDEKAKTIRKLKRGGILECEIVNLPEPVQDNPDEAPCFPVMLMCVDSRTGELLPALPMMNYDREPDPLLDAFTATLAERGKRPMAVKVRNGQTRALLEGFCAKTGILLSMDEDLPALDAAKEEFFDFMADNSDEDMDDVEDAAFDLMMELSDAELRKLPPILADHLLQMADEGMVPPELARRLRRIFR